MGVLPLSPDPALCPSQPPNDLQLAASPERGGRRARTPRGLIRGVEGAAIFNLSAALSAEICPGQSLVTNLLLNVQKRL